MLAYFILSVSVAYGTQPLSDGFTPCIRPRDFSQGRLVASYEACLQRQRVFCQSHDKVKECGHLPVTGGGSPYYKVAQDELDPTKRCKIQRDGSYKCLQDPVRLILPEETEQSAPQPSASPGGSPTATPATPELAAPHAVDVPLEENGNTGAKSPGVPNRFKTPQN